MDAITNWWAFCEFIARWLGLMLTQDGSAGHLVRNVTGEAYWYVQLACFEVLRAGCSEAGNFLVSFVSA